MARPDLTRVPEYYHKYIDQVKEDDLMKALKKQTRMMNKFLDDIPKKKRDYRYAEDKWTIKEILQHMIDAERVFAYRALCFARKDTTPLPSFDENNYAAAARVENRKWKDMIEELATVRKSTEILFDSFDEEQLENSGTANGKLVYVRAIGYIIAGHANHHINITRERYLTP